MNIVWSDLLRHSLTLLRNNCSSEIKSEPGLENSGTVCVFLDDNASITLIVCMDEGIDECNDESSDERNNKRNDERFTNGFMNPALTPPEKISAKLKRQFQVLRETLNRP
ncbi:hypothetical protein EKD02_02510 [Chlorobium phaeovibrioides]|uniref:Uncharacterized protein n=1 Tax=Chlorobium phaeovibrioides TaxID=1094 RepID=A0A432AWX5_CHLPH|nr:hypothetical protein [Chlorobium phaeovibrioides]RTY39565.1 hypothetical protein EKD02_02510 [Chlorobium phaeovibrioides]